MVETILLAIGPADSNRIGDLAEQAIALARPEGTTVILGHIISQDTYETKSQEYHEAIDQVGQDVRKEDLPRSDWRKIRIR